MAKVKRTRWGDLKCKLSLEEAAALEALLRRVGESTDPIVNAATSHLWGKLHEQREEFGEHWPTAFEAFADRDTYLVDPAK